MVLPLSERRRRGGQVAAAKRLGREPPYSLEEMFWWCVEKTDTCWFWRAGLDGHGYGMFNVGSGKRVGAHRFAYERVVGPIPNGLVLDHVRSRGCLNTTCVNPAHLEPVTVLENLRRSPSFEKFRTQGFIVPGGITTHCKNGHLFDEENTYAWRGSRKCRACNRAAQRRRKARGG